MIDSIFFANFLIALREGVEASLIVGIIVAYIVKTKRQAVLPKLWIGVILGAIIPLGIGAYMTWGPYTLTFQAQEIIGGGLSIVAAIFVTWMIFWMARNSRLLSQEMTLKTEAALTSGSTMALVWIAILSVGREGIETAVFVWATVKSTAEESILQPTLGMLAGLIVAIVIGYLIYTGASHINLSLFFKTTGFLLILVAAGVVSYGVGDLQEAGVLPGHAIYIYDVTPYFDQGAHSWLSVNSWWFVLLQAMFNVNLQPTHLQFFAWLLYLIITIPLFIYRYKGRQNERKQSAKPQMAS